MYYQNPSQYSCTITTDILRRVQEREAAYWAGQSDAVAARIPRPEEFKQPRSYAAGYREGASECWDVQQDSLESLYILLVGAKSGALDRPGPNC